MGIPVIGCDCPVCTSESPCNQRLRPSALVTLAGKKLLIDCGPDFRLQALKYRINRLDGLLLTHSHHDHIAGIDELRVYYLNTREALPCLLSDVTAEELKMRFNYIFNEREESSTIMAKLTLYTLHDLYGVTTFLGYPIQYVSYEQAGMQVTGFRFGDLAYLTDIRTYTDQIFQELQGVKTLILGATKMQPSFFHFSLDEAVAFARRVKATHTWLTHVAHELDHEFANSYLPSDVRMAYDGLELTFSI